MKYWPNEFGKNATSEGQDRLTFFAYAPYVNVNPSTGRVIKGENDGDNGIVGLTSNTASGDPYVKYYVDMDPDKRVDLCWGVAKKQFIASVDEEAVNLVDAGWPYIDVVKPTTNSKIDFDFKHALAAVNVQIDTDVDVTGHDDNAADVDRYTRIWVRSVTFEGFTDKGRLNLNSNADPNSAESGPQWIDLTTDSPVASGVVTVYDGRTDGKEGRDNAIAKKESPATLNAKIIQSAPYSKQALENADEAARKLTISEAVPGVTKAKVNLFDSDALEAPVYVIPTDDNLKVTIVYDVETYDPNLAAFLSDGAVKGSSVQNTIEKEITFQPESGDAITKLEAGKSYTINLHLGLTSVKFDANVVSGDNTPYIPGGADLPANTTSIGSVTLTDDSTTPSIPYADLTIWKNETISTVPKVTVLDGDNNEIPLNKVDISWASNNTAVATVDATGAVTIQGAAGVAIITCTASQGEGNSKSASYNVNVNEVTGISLPATASVGKGSSTSIAATISHTGHGTITSTPTIAWASADEAKVAAVASSTTDNSATITGVTPGTANVTASVSEDCAASSAAASATCAVTCTDPSLTAFRGYDVSPGILKRNTNGTYELTSGTDPFEMYTIYDYDSDTKLSQYYFKWSFIVDENELGDGSNIIANSPKLKGWSFPSLGDMETIIKGTPKTDIKIDNNKLTTYPFAVVKYNDRKGVLLLRDGITLDGNIVSGIAFGVKNINTLSDAQYNHFLEKGCIILSFTGYHTGSNWYGPNIQYYGAVNFWLTNGKAVDLSDMAVTTTTSIPVTPNNQSGTKSFTIHLVKKL